jgi:DNA-binding protein H-NS
VINTREFTGLKLKELLRIEADLKDIITERKQVEAKEVRNEVQEFIQKRGFNLQELGFTRTQKGYKATMAPKYRNPDNPKETWTGHGRKPNWMLSAFGKGAKLDDFRV